MSRILPIAEAAPAAEALLADVAVGGSVPSRDALIEVIRRLAQLDFETPDTPESDGFLFQYGIANWLPDPAFVVSFVRQFEIVDQQGEHDHYSQLRLELRCATDQGLESLGSRTTWWFKGGPSSFSSWLSDAASDAVWEQIAHRDQVKFSISQGDV